MSWTVFSTGRSNPQAKRRWRQERQECRLPPRQAMHQGDYSHCVGERTRLTEKAWNHWGDRGWETLGRDGGRRELGSGKWMELLITSGCQPPRRLNTDNPCLHHKSATTRTTKSTSLSRVSWLIYPQDRSSLAICDNRASAGPRSLGVG